MLVNVAGLRNYMVQRNLAMVAVEVPDVNVPAFGYNKPKVLAKRLIITQTPQAGGQQGHITYAMYNSFNKSSMPVPADFSFEILDGDTQVKMIAEYEEHKSGLEKIFREAYADHHPTIKEKLQAALDLIQEAKQLSNDTGIPFTFEPPDGNSSDYVPPTFKQKFGGSADVISALENLSGIYYEYDGWHGAWDSSSANC